MKIIKPNVELIVRPEENKSNPLKFIERIGRVCYKSEDNITSDSAERFVDMIVRNGHTSVLEHLHIGTYLPASLTEKYSVEKKLKYFHIEKLDDSFYYIFGNVRAFLDLYNSIQDSRFIVDVFKNNGISRILGMGYTDTCNEINIALPKFSGARPVTFRIVCDRGITHEIVRHRVQSFTQESTRYCNYSKDKFDGQVSFIMPKDISPEAEIEFERFYLEAEDTYMNLLKMGISPQIARSVLPHGLKTEIYCTASFKDWKHFISLRKSNKAHPQVRFIAEQIEAYLNEVINDILR